MSHVDESKSQIINFIALEYEFDDFEKIIEKYALKFIRKQKSLYYPNSFEWDVTVMNPEENMIVNYEKIPTVIIMRTCVCKLVYFNKYRTQVILQISEYSSQNSLTCKFIHFVEKLETFYKIDSEFRLIKKDSKYNNFSIIIDYDPDGFTWFDREGKPKDHLNVPMHEKINVAGIMYLDKKISKNADGSGEPIIGFRWRLFQLRDIYLRPQKCMVRLSTDSAAPSDNDTNFYVPFYSGFPGANYVPPPPPPPPPPPLPPVFKISSQIKKNQIINKIKKDSNQQFVVSQDELMQVMKKIKSREIL